jgi:hypothetical protein
LEHGAATLAQGLTTAWTLVAIAFLALGILAYVAVRNRKRRVNAEEAIQTFRSLDIEAFRNLVSADEEAFLRSNLPPRKFHEIKRQRAWAAFIYAWEAGKAATALAEVGHAAQRSPDPKVAAFGVQVAESAFRLRLQTIGACLRLLTEIAVPELQSRPAPPLVDQYQRTAETLFGLSRFATGRFQADERAST